MAVIRLCVILALVVLLAVPGTAQQRVSPQTVEVTKTIGAQRRVENYLETQRIIKEYADALKVPNHVRTYCAVELADRMHARRQADREHPLFASGRDAIFGAEGGRTILRGLQEYELAHQQLCLLNAMRTLDGFLALPLPRP